MWDSLSRGSPTSGDSWKMDTGASTFCHNNWCMIQIANQDIVSNATEIVYLVFNLKNDVDRTAPPPPPPTTTTTTPTPPHDTHTRTTLNLAVVTWMGTMCYLSMRAMVLNPFLYIYVGSRNFVITLANSRHNAKNTVIHKFIIFISNILNCSLVTRQYSKWWMRYRNTTRHFAA